MTRKDCIAAIYAAFSSGDIPAILAHLSADIDWEYAGNWDDIPWLRRRRGHAGVIEFFRELGETMQIEHFQPICLLEGPDVVAGIVDIRFVVIGNGRRVDEKDEVHLWHFDAEGKVARFRHRIDTRLQAQAYLGV